MQTEIDLKKFPCAGCGKEDDLTNLQFQSYSDGREGGFYVHRKYPDCHLNAAMNEGVFIEIGNTN